MGWKCCNYKQKLAGKYGMLETNFKPKPLRIINQRFIQNRKLNINADMGEGIPNEAALMPYVSSCSIACGGHAGSAKQIELTMDLAVQNDVKIGAHPSYIDKQNFGRKKLALSKEEFKSQIAEQLDLFCKIARKKNMPIHHVKAHGALYHEINSNQNSASNYLEVVTHFFSDIILYAPFQSLIYKLAKEKFKMHTEAFIDRRYNAQGTLVSRTNPNGLIRDEKEAWQQLKLILEHQKAFSIERKEITVKGETFCIHGDNPNALKILQYIRNQEDTILI